MKKKTSTQDVSKPARGALCGACGQGLRSTKATQAFVASFDVLELRWVCAACAARGIVIVSAEASQRTAAVLRPFAQHLRRLAKPYEMNGDGRAVGLLQAADVLESGRAVSIDVEPPSSSTQNGKPPRPFADEILTPKEVRELKPIVLIEDDTSTPLGKAVAAADRKAAAAGGELGGCELSLLVVLACQQNALSRVELGLRAGYSVTSGGYSAALGQLREKALIEAAGVGGIRSTPAGRQALLTAPPIEVPGDVIDYWATKVGGAMSTILLVATAAYPKGLSRVELAERAGYRPTSGGYSAALGQLRRLHLLDGCRASDALMMSAKLPPHNPPHHRGP